MSECLIDNIVENPPTPANGEVTLRKCGACTVELTITGTATAVMITGTPSDCPK